MAFPFTNIIPIPGFPAMLSLYGKIFKKKLEYKVTANYNPSITAIIPALNEANRIPYAIASLNIQTTKPNKLVVIDDGSKDNTSNVVESLRKSVEFPIEIIRNEKPRGKTSGIKRAVRRSDSDKVFILDADTYLQSPNYLEKILSPHINNNVASTFGIVESMSRRDKKKFFQEYVSKNYSEENQTKLNLERILTKERGIFSTLSYLMTKWPVEQYRNTLYNVDQYFFRESHMRLFGTNIFPVGCGVMYDRKKLKNVFDQFEETLGDKLTNSEDIFLGFAFANKGLSNIQVKNVIMKTSEPNIKRVFHQTYLWGSSYLQSAYYFKDLTKRFRKKPVNENSDNAERIKQPLGRLVTAQLLDGLYPFTLGTMAGLAAYEIIEPKFVYILPSIEFAMFSAITIISSPKKLKNLPSLLVSAPIRLAQIPNSLYTNLRFLYEVIINKRDWKK